MKRVAVFALLSLFVSSPMIAAQAQQVILDSSTIPQFAQPLPTLSIAPQNGTMTTMAATRPITLRMCEFRAAVLPPGTVPDYRGTWVFGYLIDPVGNRTCVQLISLYGNAEGVVDTYLGPVLVNERGKPTEITFVNDLGHTSTSHVVAVTNSTDQTLHWADPLHSPPALNPCAMEIGIPPFGSDCSKNFSGPIPAVPHLHGAEVPAEIDGGPESWFTSDGLHHGHRYYTAGAPGGNAVTFRYPNLQEAAPIWFHDHALGITRLNVYAGLAGAYFIRDPALQLPSNLQPLSEVIPLVIQDRMFDTSGQLFFQAGRAGGELWALNPEHPYWSPEFIGDTIVVNGKVWPYLPVEPRRYRFLLLNGSNARSYELFFTGNPRNVPEMWVIGTDGGYLDHAVKVSEAVAMKRRAAMPAIGSQSRLLIMPGERYELIIDFSGIPSGSRLVLRNSANAPYPSGDEVGEETTARVMEFRITDCASGRCGAGDSSFDPSSASLLRSGAQKIVRLANPATASLANGVNVAVTRLLTLNEVVMEESRTEVDPITGETIEYPGGPLEVLLNNTEFAPEVPRPFDDFQKITVNGVTTEFSERPAEGTTEVWEIANLTADAHPIHLHLVQMQILNRQRLSEDYIPVYESSFAAGAYVPAIGPPFDYRADKNPKSAGKQGGNPDVAPYLVGPPRPPGAHEAGWKDTVVVRPGEVTRLVIRWAPTNLPVNAATADLAYAFDPTGSNGASSYVWHCHILDHEDNEMMRPSLPVKNPAAPAVRTLKKGIDY